MAEELSDAIVKAAQKMHKEDMERVEFAGIFTCFLYANHTCSQSNVCNRLMKGGIPCNTKSTCYKSFHCKSGVFFNSLEPGIEPTKCGSIGTALSRLQRKGFTRRDEEVERLLTALYGFENQPLVMKKMNDSKKRCYDDDAVDAQDLSLDIARAGAQAGLDKSEWKEKEYFAIAATADFQFRVVTSNSEVLQTVSEFHDAEAKAKEGGYSTRETVLEKFCASARTPSKDKCTHIFSRAANYNSASSDE